MQLTDFSLIYSLRNLVCTLEITFLLLLLIVLIFPFLLSAIPQDLEVFTDFEDIGGEGEFFTDEEPARVTVIGFKVETLEGPLLLHLGSKAITLGLAGEPPKER